MIHMTSRKGFTVVEILVALAIIGLIGTFAAIAVSSARSKERDATRLSHVRQVQSALEDFFVDNNAYPAGTGLALGFSAAGCLNTDGFTPSCEASATNVILRAVPATVASGLKGQSACGGAGNAYCYNQISSGQTYSIQFELENDVPLANLVKGLNCATPDGMAAGACPAAQ